MEQTIQNIIAEESFKATRKIIKTMTVHQLFKEIEYARNSNRSESIVDVYKEEILSRCEKPEHVYIRN